MKKQLAMGLMLAAIGACKGRNSEHQQQRGLDISRNDPPPPEEDLASLEDTSGGTGTAMALDEGKMGKKDSDRAEGQYKMKKSEAAPAMSREQAIDDAK